jgi:predicted nucleic acid-binding protein
MKITVDSSVLIAVALGEPERDGLIRAANGHSLIAPEALPCEIGNALSAMVRKKKLLAGDVPVAWEALQAIPVELRAIEFLSALEIATRFGVYAYDAYYLDCALRLRAPLLTLDRAMKHIAGELSIPVLEYES